MTVKPAVLLVIPAFKSTLAASQAETIGVVVRTGFARIVTNILLADAQPPAVDTVTKYVPLVVTILLICD